MITTVAPAKIILFGEHAVNRRQMGIVAALDLETRCELQARDSSSVLLQSDGECCETDCAALKAFADKINELRASDERAAIREEARDFFAPTRYVYGTFLARYGGSGTQVTWDSKIPPGSGLGSGAAASAALVLALARANQVSLTLHEVAELAWHGDIIAHGGIASGLDTSGSTFGGIISYTVRDGARPLVVRQAPTLVIGDTGVRANTAVVNARVNEWLAQDAGRNAIFETMGAIARRAQDKIEHGDWQAVGGLMNENHACLREIGVSSPELETLVAAALQAGAQGAKLAGAGGGGVMVALTTPDDQHKIARAIENAGGRAYAVRAGVQGVRDE